MALIDQVRALLKRIRGEGETGPTTADETPEPAHLTETVGRFSADRTRAQVVRRCREMYETDPRAKGVVETLARDITRGGFTVSCPDTPEAEELSTALAQRLDLDSRLDDWVRYALRDGDSFLEVGVDAEMNIAIVTRKPALEMHRNSNRADRFDDPERAYWWADTFWSGFEAPADAVWFADWQIIHARWAHDEGSRYGTPLFAPATGAWKRVVEGERDIAVRRKTRAGMRYNHRFPEGTDQAVIKAYREENKDALDNPYAAVADFFGTVDINAIQGDARLSDIDDVRHHIRTWWLSSPVPMSLLGYGQDLNRDVLQEQKEQYDEAIPVLQMWVTDEIVRPLLELEWMLHGLWPPHLDYEIQWQRKQTLKPADLQALADAALKFRALGVSDDAIADLLAMFITGVDLKALMAVQGPRGANTADIGKAV